MKDGTVFSGFLREEGGVAFIEGEGGRRLEGRRIWQGYLTHWKGRPVNARALPQRDYENGEPIIILWPREAPHQGPFFDLYYNERLVKYPASTFGHIAININGAIFNYSHLINENEIISPEEYLYRPALGEFAPHPVTGRFDLSDPARPYYDKFGRNFMRTIHAARVQGADIGALDEFNREMMRHIHEAPVDPKRPHKYSEFRFFSRNCSTIIRDGLRAIGFAEVRGVFPRDMFISAVASFLRARDEGRILFSLRTMPQLMVPEAPGSKLSPLLNPLNRVRYLRLRRLMGLRVHPGGDAV